MTTGTSFGQWLRKHRKALDLTQEAFARQVGCSTAMLRKLEAEERRPSRPMAERLANLLGVSPGDQAAFLRFARGDPHAATPTLLTTTPTAGQAQPRPHSVSHHLPAALTPLIGRKAQVTTIRRHLLGEDTRLLTLIGPPGIGKTRLSQHVANEMLADFEDGVFFVVLAPIRDPALVVPAIAQAVGLQEIGSQPLGESLKDWLHNRRLLLVLDNFEQVMDASPVVVDLLVACPGLKVLVTSREALGTIGERVFPVPTLAVPPIHSLSTGRKELWKGLLHYAAIRLFVERAQAVQPGIVLNTENAAAVVSICTYLDGLPLAIELIAARVQLLPLPALLTQLSGRLILQVEGMRGMPDRQKTLYRAIQWSYDLLTVEERTLFARLGVFVGGWTLEAAQVVTESGGQTPEGLAALARKSLVQAPTTAGEPRYAMLETIREYALERLEAGGEAEAVQRRHADYYLTLAETAEPHLIGPQQTHWLNRLEVDHNNLRAALAWGLASGEVALAMRLSTALFRFWLVHGHLSEGRRWLGQVLAMGPPECVPAALRSKALNAAGSLAGTQNEMAQASALFEESLVLRRRLGDRLGVASLLNNLGVAERHQGDYRRAAELLEESLALSRELDATTQIAHTLNNLGLVANRQGDNRRAQALLEESLALHRERGDRHSIAGTLHELGRVTLEQADVNRADSLYRESLAVLQELGDKVGLADCLEGLAGVAGVRGEPVRAVRLLSVADALREFIRAPVLSAYRPAYDRTLQTIRTQLDEAAFAVAWSEGRAMTLEQAIALVWET